MTTHPSEPIRWTPVGDGHWTRHKWCATVENDVQLTVFYIPATVNRTSQPDAPGWFLDIESPETGVVADIYLAPRLKAARTVAGLQWWFMAAVAVQDASAEDAFHARWATGAVRRQGAPATEPASSGPSQ